MLFVNGNVDLFLFFVMLFNWKVLFLVVDILICDFVSGIRNSIINGFAIGEKCCVYIWKEENV